MITPVTPPGSSVSHLLTISLRMRPASFLSTFLRFFASLVFTGVDELTLLLCRLVLPCGTGGVRLQGYKHTKRFSQKQNNKLKHTLQLLVFWVGGRCGPLEWRSDERWLAAEEEEGGDIFTRCFGRPDDATVTESFLLDTAPPVNHTTCQSTVTPEHLRVRLTNMDCIQRTDTVMLPTG